MSHPFAASSPAPAEITAAEAAGRALRDAGVSMVNCVPAAGASAVFEAWMARTGIHSHWHFHEEVALGMAMGASLAGRRSAVVIKAHGFAKAANALIDALPAGAEGGLVMIITSDREGSNSDSIFDTDAFVAGTHLPFRRLYPHELYEGILRAFDLSESMGLPVAIIVEEGDLAHRVSVPAAAPARQPSVAVPPRDPLRHTLFPGNRYPYEVMQAKLAGRDWRDILRPALPVLPDGLPEKFHSALRSSMPVFDLLKEMRAEIDFIMGDTGTSSLFVCPPYELLDATTYYGGSIPMTAGALLCGAKKAWAVTGDWSFTAAGHLGLHEAFHRGLPVKVLIFHNGEALATGGQILDEKLFERLLMGYEEFVRRVEVRDGRMLEHILRSAQESDRMEIVVVDFV
ncbi:MAG: hypothetical protein HGA62_09025 [Chlorobiaceae bacterium]|nr:hypothetical protein [Chlorobiaceae bacterium]NTV61853.1 hypothetical protein [Chlorobiaceae bacterium]